MKNKTLLYYFWSGAIVLSLLLVLFALCFASFSGRGDDGATASQPGGSQAAGSDTSATPVSPDAAATDPGAAATDPAASPSPSGNGLSSPAKLPETEDFGQEYLEKFYFLGDSTTYGLAAYDCVDDGRVWTSASGTLTLPNWSYTNIHDLGDGSEMSLPDIAAAKKPEYLLITLGCNGVAFLSEEDFKDTYRSMVQAIQAATPDTVIIFNSIFPVAASYSQNSQINNTKITAANSWILALAEEMGIRYLDTNAYLKGADGYLPEYYQSGDGLHLTPAAYEIILNCVRTHGYSE